MQDLTKKAFFQNALLMATADGTIAPLEKDFVQLFMDKAGIAKTVGEEWYRELKGGDIGFRTVKDHQEAIQMLKLIVGVAAADSNFDPREKHAIVQIAKACGVGFAELQALVKENWQRDVLSDILGAPRAGGAPTGGDLLLLEDDFGRADAFKQAAPGLAFHPIGTSALLNAPVSTRCMVVHAADDRDKTKRRMEIVKRAAGGALIVGIVGRHQVSQISYLLEGGAAKCLIEDVYPGEFAKILEEAGLLLTAQKP